MLDHEQTAQILPLRTRKVRKSKTDANGGPVVGKRDEFIMDTNNSSIVSKRSVEKLYYAGQPEYFRYFVRKFHRRSPLINRGYWLRMKAIEKTVSRFLAEEDGKTKLVVNLGCGYDPLPFQFLGLRPDQCKDCVFVDVDYPALMERKLEMIKSNQPLLDLLPDLALSDPPTAVLGSTLRYKAIGCNLNDVSSLDRALRQIFDLESSSVSILFVAEVSVAYMERKAADAVLSWASKLKDARFCLLEQHLPDGPDHPFAQTMLKHFEKLRTPLHTIGTIDQMRERFVSTGWDSERVHIQTLWELWSDNTFLSSQERQSLDRVEPFDEWEEFALFGSHYFLLEARTGSAPFKSSSDEDHSITTEAGRERWKSEAVTDCVSPKRRFAAAIGPSVPVPDQATVDHAGGLGSQERLRTVDTLSNLDSEKIKPLPDLPVALMCHTLTRVGRRKSEVLLVGGRTSPDKASAACWLSDGGEWKQIDSIRTARYRHCAVGVTIGSGESAESGALIYGGKTSTGAILDDCWFFSRTHGWREVQALSSRPMEARFGAAMATEQLAEARGVLVGGMKDDGTVISECWSWKLDKVEDRLEITFSTCSLPGTVRLQPRITARFGAQLVSTATSMILIGGISGSRMLDRDTEVVNLSTGSLVSIEHSVRPLLVGFSALDVGGVIGIFGGGATCFSFGTCWSQSCIMAPKGWQAPVFMSQELKCVSLVSQHDREATTLTTLGTRSKVNGHSQETEPVLIGRRTISDGRSFEDILQQSEPVILEGMNLGACKSNWTTEYLKDKVGADREVVVHNSSGPDMDFQAKNFAYEKMPFGNLLDMVTEGKPVYLRALSSDKPADSPTSLAKDFPSIAADFVLPDQLSYAQRNQHSSPLRISGPVNMWLHYDVMANILCQIRGTKHLRLFSPSSVTHLAIRPGASSSSLNVFDTSTESHLRSAGITIHEAHLSEGDVLFIPPLWLHAARPTEGLSIAVNVFFRDERMQAAYAAGKDVYGNRDVAAYERGRAAVQRVARGFDGLPAQVRGFYLERLAEELRRG